MSLPHDWVAANNHHRHPIIAEEDCCQTELESSMVTEMGLKSAALPHHC